MGTYVITEPCIGVKDGSCVDVCPVDCIHTDDDAPQFYIEPHECIHCSACVEVCPVNAIYRDDELPEKYQRFVEVNAAYFGVKPY
jgi:NAD-dependent dihydropyrimidine dehydrogenase PreA subunit